MRKFKLVLTNFFKKKSFVSFYLKCCSPYRLVNPSAISTLRWHFDFYIVKIGMPQKGLKKDDGVRGRREELSSKFFPFFPDHKSTFIGNRA